MEAEVPNAAGLYDDSDPDLAAASSPLRHHQQLQQLKKKVSFLAGFRDCHQEVLRYLVGIEQVPLEGPVVYGLERHLTDLETFMQASIGRCDTVVSGPCERQPRQGSGDPRDRQTEERDDEEEAVSAENNDIPIDESSFDSGCDSSLAGSAGAERSMNGVVVEGGLAEESAPPSADRPDGEADDGRTAIGESELAENALELMHLANGNPRISRILNELFVLMDNDYDDDDDDDYDDDDDDDGIEIEEVDGTDLELQDD